jgi:membrane metallo-endopeptidase-like protein 1
MILSRITFLPQRFIELWSELKQALTGADQDSSRWRTCVNFVHENFGMAVGRMFVTKHFDERAKANALSMIGDIRAAFIELLDEVTWLDNNTRTVARQKAAAMTENIGYPDYILNNTALDKDYEDVRIDPKKYFENVLSILNITTQISLRQLRQPVDKMRWSTPPAVVNAYYSNTKNRIMFPAGILQPPFYHENYPKFLNYGGIGMVIGHEITHGFDDMGRQLDKDGNLKQWWTDDVISTFKSRAQCIIDQYSNYSVTDVNLNLNGHRTQGENIADNGGLKQAFRAYRRLIERQGQEEPVLPGLNMTSNQLFFLNFAQIWCGTARPESYIQYIRTNLHSPGQFRVIGTLSNSVDFAEAFHCPVNSRMNPANKCQVW